ncbi:spore coat protein YlbD [Massilibacterium senegalense]|uniref:spore coat protein YlbD n=1 Tax=Massilibacterium senegalense TaxID=1632858 RepID=UPI0007810071|nr:spore coat protein YlbD [Massilibacterium senegalense]
MKARHSVEEFRDFVKRHPKLREEVLNGKKSWQEIYEDWVILGEDNSRFEPYKAQQREWIQQMVGMWKNVNFEEVQNHLSQLDKTLSQLQQLFDHFQGNQGTNKRPISYRKD